MSYNPIVVLTSILTRMFIRPGLIKAIQELHAGMTSSMDAALAFAGVVNPTVADILCLPDANGLPSPDAATHQAVKKYVLDKSLPKMFLNVFKVYNQIHCTVLERMRDFVAYAQSDGYDLENVKPSAHVLQELGLLAPKSSSCLAMKYAWLHFGFGDYQNPKYMHYWGNSARTSPVSRYLHKHFGLTNPSQPQVNEITFGIAHETGMDPMYVNAAMWLLG